MLPNTIETAHILVPANADIESLGEDDFFLGVTPIMQKLRVQAELLAQADVPVLILGEPGSGKGTVARLIHKLSVFSGFKFRRVNCAEMPGDLLELELFGRENDNDKEKMFYANSGRASVGKLENGEKGTLLLDEITEMPITLQARLAQVLQEKRSIRDSGGQPVEPGIRILAASSDDVNCALAENRLRADLYYRLSAFTIHVPALRQRREAITTLLRYSMHKLARYYRLPPREFSPAALTICQNYSWPGNLKELENFVKRYLVAGDEELLLSGLEPDSSNERSQLQTSNPKLAVIPTEEVESDSGDKPAKSLKSLIQDVKSETERRAIALALEKTGWNRKAAARLLGVSYRAILYKIEQYHMSASELRASSLTETNLADSDPAKKGKAS